MPGVFEVGGFKLGGQGWEGRTCACWRVADWPAGMRGRKLVWQRVRGTGRAGWVSPQVVELRCGRASSGRVREGAGCCTLGDWGKNKMTWFDGKRSGSRGAPLVGSCLRWGGREHLAWPELLVARCMLRRRAGWALLGSGGFTQVCIDNATG